MKRGRDTSEEIPIIVLASLENAVRVLAVSSSTMESMEEKWTHAQELFKSAFSEFFKECYEEYGEDFLPFEKNSLEDGYAVDVPVYDVQVSEEGRELNRSEKGERLYYLKNVDIPPEGKKVACELVPKNFYVSHGSFFEIERQHSWVVMARQI